MNIFHMKNQVTARHALLQVILAMKDAISLPLTTVRSAWATSMHDLKKGNVGCQDATQWSLNRISASQIAMATPQATTSTQFKKTCKYFNEGTWSQEASHGMYRHIYSYCERKDKTANHPEQKCSKTWQIDKQQTNDQGQLRPLGLPPLDRDSCKRPIYNGERRQCFNCNKLGFESNNNCISLIYNEHLTVYPRHLHNIFFDSSDTNVDHISA